MSGFRNIDEYRAALDADQDELVRFMNDVFNRTTGFFRDATAWRALARSVLPRWKKRSTPLRIWSAGCASGEEVWTAAMLLNEVLGDDAYHHRVRIIATDVHSCALQRVRAACYSTAALTDVPEPYRRRYFVRDGNTYRVTDRLRQPITTIEHDLLRDQPVPAVDLLFCRNTMIYFTHDARVTLLSRLHRVIRPGGILFLGMAELPFASVSLFRPLAPGSPIFVRHARRLSAASRPRAGVHASGAPTGSTRRDADVISHNYDCNDEMDVAQPHIKTVVDSAGLPFMDCLPSSK